MQETHPTNALLNASTSPPTLLTALSAASPSLLRFSRASASLRARVLLLPEGATSLRSFALSLAVKLTKSMAPNEALAAWEFWDWLGGALWKDDVLGVFGVRGVRGGLDWERERARVVELWVVAAVVGCWEVVEGRFSSVAETRRPALMGPGLWMDLRRWWVFSWREGERLCRRQIRGLMLSGERGGDCGRLGEWRVVRGVVKGEVLWRMPC